ncbi:MAG: type III secretion system chaperone [Desulfovibrio sp.]|nr:type III secretion system chaperone [Desulfovibrio sp.]
MNTSSKVEDCIKHLNEVTGLNLTLDARQTTQFSYQGRTVLLRFVPELAVLVVHAPLESLEEAAIPGALSDLLEANFMLSSTGGGALSWSQETRLVALNFFLPLDDADSFGFINRLNRLLALTDEWTNRLRELNSMAVANKAKQLLNLRKGTTADSIDLLQQNSMLRP